MTLTRVLGGCGDDGGNGLPDSGPPPDGGYACDAPETTIGSNHGHVMVVSMADVDAGVMKVYHIQGSATHDHTVTLTPGHFTALKTTALTMATSSSTDSHTHPITVMC